jgi:hypothetical protein
MTQGNETPGIGGVPGTGSQVRAATAWHRLLHGQFVTVPAALARSSRGRRRIRATGKIGRR